MDNLLNEFLTETSDSLGIVDAALIALAQNPEEASQIDNIFRLVHTIRGTCGFLGLPRLEAVAHAGENVLGKIRDKELKVTADVVTIILEAMDIIKDVLEAMEQTEQEPEGDDSDLIHRLNEIAYGTTSSQPASVAAIVARAPALDDRAILGKATKNAASELGLKLNELAQIIGKDRTSINRGISPDSKSGELALLFIRAYRGLHALLGGDTKNMAHWFATNNKHLNGTPKDLVKSIQGLSNVVSYLDGMRGKI